MSADLGKPLEEFVENLVKPGRDGSKSEVLREGVRLMQEREAKQAALEALLAPGLADADAGRTRDMVEVFGELRSELEAMREGRHARKLL